ncbi:hypothetical protein FQZ97_1071560 [compost metagenome]
MAGFTLVQLGLELGFLALDLCQLALQRFKLFACGLQLLLQLSQLCPGIRVGSLKAFSLFALFGQC